MQRILINGLNASIVGVTALLMVLAVWGKIPLDELKALIAEDGNVIMSGMALSFIMFLATVVAPLTTVFLVPVAAGVIGPAWAALFSALGWFLGSLAAFIIARYFGKPLLLRLVSFEKINLYERYIPKDMSFWTLVLLRMALPPDILSYAIGTFSSMRFITYAVASAIGLLPFAFIVAYAGSAFFAGQYALFVGLAVIGVLVFLFVWRAVVKGHSVR